MEDEIKQLQKQIEEQIKTNINFYKKICTPSKKDPENKKGEPFLEEWRKGKDKLRKLTNLLNQKLNLKLNLKNTQIETSNEKTFVNCFGEATKRYITTTSNEKNQKKIKQFFLRRLK